MTDSTHTLKRSFRDAMASCAAGVHVITTDGEAGRYGITMTAVTAVTDEPPTVMLCINRQSAIIPILQGNRDLCINTLNDSQQDIAEHFAGLTDLSPENASNTIFGIEGKPGSSKSRRAGAPAWQHCRSTRNRHALRLFRSDQRNPQYRHTSTGIAVFP